MIVEQLIIILGIFLEGEYALGSKLPETSHLNRKLMMEGTADAAADASYLLYLSGNCVATQLSEGKIATTRNDCEATQACKTPPGGGGGGGGGEASGEPAATTAAAAGADDSAASEASAAPDGGGGGEGGGGGGAGGDCTAITESVKVDNLELYTYDYDGSAITTAGGDNGPCFVIAFVGGTASKGKAECTVGDSVDVKADGVKLCPGDSGAPVINESGELVGILNKIDACGDSATAIKGTTAMDAVKGGGGAGGDGDSSTPKGGSPSITASMIVIGFTGILITLFA